jgi:hypothetical protein
VHQTSRSLGPVTIWATRSGCTQTVASLESMDGVLAMAVRPGAHADCVDIVRFEDPPRVGLDAHDAELVGNVLTARFGTVAYGDQLHTIDRLQAGNVLQRGIPTGANEANPQDFAHQQHASSLNGPRF